MKELLNSITKFLSFQEEVFGTLPDLSEFQSKPASLNIDKIDTSQNQASLTFAPTAQVTRKVDSEKTLHQKLNECTTLSELLTFCRKHENYLKMDLPESNLVFGVGDEKADLLVIGEAPGFHEDKQKEPFVGEAGKLLDKILKSINFDRQQIYITNIIKHRPKDNRTPNKEECERSLPFLIRQIEIVNPKIILSVGKISAQTLLNSENNLGELRSNIHRSITEHEVIVTYHPAFLLRAPQYKRQTWHDVQLLRKRYNELGGK